MMVVLDDLCGRRGKREGWLRKRAVMMEAEIKTVCVCVWPLVYHNVGGISVFIYA